MKDFYKECGIDETMLWSNNKRRSKGLPMFRQCGYHKRKKDVRDLYMFKKTVEKLMSDLIDEILPKENRSNGFLTFVDCK